MLNEEPSVIALHRLLGASLQLRIGRVEGGAECPASKVLYQFVLLPHFLLVIGQVRLRSAKLSLTLLCFTAPWDA